MPGRYRFMRCIHNGWVTKKDTLQVWSSLVSSFYELSFEKLQLQPS